MFNEHPVEYLTDNDLYKFTMQQFVLHQFPSATVKAEFKCRTKGINLYRYILEIQKEIEHVATLKFTKEELSYLSTLRFLTADYIDFLEDFQLKTRHVTIKPVDVKEGDNMYDIEIILEGPWLQVILWEVYILKIVHEVYSRNEHADYNDKEGRWRLQQKIEKINEAGIVVVDFGSRRAFSSNWHDKVVSLMVEGEAIKGTSNVMLAHRYGIKAIGTMAHEVFQACQGMDVKSVKSQQLALDKWSREFRGDLGIALTDTLGVDKFLVDFDPYFAKLFDGVRHDSGPAKAWGDKIIAHYRMLGINPATKTAVFSDGLDVDKAIDLAEYFHKRINVSFGIGTNLTNDMGFPFLQIVMKLTECNGYPVAKISDDPSKTMCRDSRYVEYLRDAVQRDVMEKEGRYVSKLR